MAVGTKLKGISGQFYNGGVKVSALQDVSFDVQLTDFDFSDHDSSGWGERGTGIAQWNAKATCWYLDGDTNQQAFQNAAVPGTVLAFAFYPNGIGSGKTQWTGNGRLKGFKYNAPNTGGQSLDFDIVGVGPLTLSTQP